MADNSNDAIPQPKDAHKEVKADNVADPAAALRAEGNTTARPPEGKPTAGLHDVPIGQSVEAAKPLARAGDNATEAAALKAADAPVVPKDVPLNGITDETTLRHTIQDALKQAKDGAPVNFDVDTRVKLTGADGKPIKGTQASILMDEMQKAYPERSFTFAKPDLNPGDKGYAEIPAPAISKDGIHLSTKENPITTAKDIPLADGGTLPAGSKFEVGTLMDGNNVKSADPTGKVWATTPDGKFVQVADAGKTATLPADSISTDPHQAGQLPSKGDHIIVRTSKAVDPDGKPLLDAYPNNADSFNANYKPGTAPDMYAAKPKSADHFLLPPDVSVKAETEYGPASASGAKQDYFMSSGFADAKDATAKNYTGVTDLRSATELMRIRTESGMTDHTQVEAGLAKVTEALAKPGEVSLKGITDEATMRAAIREGIAQAKEGKPVSFDVDTRLPVTSSDGKPIKGATEASILYDEMKKAYPQDAYVFSKPDLKPGDKGYSEIPAPEVTKDGIHLSTKENMITTEKAFTAPNGEQVPAGSQFEVGTMLDGQTLKSADPQGKVWAKTPDGKMIELADAGKSFQLQTDVVSSDPKKAGQLPNKGDHIIVRTGSGTDPDGKPLLDAYPNDAAGFSMNYKPGSSPDMFAAKPKSADHFKLPENVTVQADTAYGPSTASGAKQDYFMTSGFADAKDATAKNYTGVTDQRSAQELMRIRSESGMTETTQVEAGLKAAQAAEAAKHAPAEAAPKPAGLDSIAVADINKAVTDFGSKITSADAGKAMFMAGLKDPEVMARFLEDIKDPAARDMAKEMVDRVKGMNEADQARFQESLLNQKAGLDLAGKGDPEFRGGLDGISKNGGLAVAVLIAVSAAIAYTKSAQAAEAAPKKKVPFFTGN